MTTMAESIPAASVAARLRERFGPRAVALVLTLLIEAVLVLAVLSLGLASNPPKQLPGTKLVSVAFKPADDDRPQTEPKSAKTAAATAVQTSRAPSATPEAAPAPSVPTPVTPPPPPIIPIASGQLAALDISRLPRQPNAPGPPKRMMGPVDSGVPGDSKRIGSAPNGQPLYAAAWYREPYPDELAGYLSTAEGPGYALIACRTAPDWRVEDCVGLAEYPSGSNLQRAVLAAAWQFRVRPPRLGGVYKVGEWVRIRIDYTERASR